MSWKRPTKGREIRAAKGIVGLVGPNGSGKTMLMVWDTIPTLEMGWPVLSTVRLLDYTDPRPCEDETCHEVVSGSTLWRWTPEPCDKTDPRRHRQAHPLWVPFREWRQAMEWEYGDILMDEVSGVAGARDHTSMPSEVGNHLQQLRKGDCVTRWTAPSWSRADTIIRQCTQLIVSCRGRLPVEHKAAPGERQRRWRQNRLIWAKSYDAEDVDEFNEAKRKTLKTVNTDRHYLPGSVVLDLYDTYAKSLHIGTLTASGRCMDCHGMKKRSYCTCPPVETAEVIRLSVPPSPSPSDPGAGGSPRAGSGTGAERDGDRETLPGAPSSDAA